MLKVGVFVVFERDEGVALRIGEHAQRTGQIAGHFIQAGTAGGAGQNTDDNGKQRAGDFVLRRSGQFGRVDEQRFVLRVANRIDDALRPGILHRLPEDLKQAKLAGEQFRQCRDDADERVQLAGRERQHEFMFQTEFHCQHFIAA